VIKQAPELSPEARRIINEARGVDDPTAEDQARVKARWLASVAAVAGVSSLTEAARAAGGIGWGLKAAGAALVAAAAAIGLYVAVPSGRTAETGQSDAPRPSWTGTTHDRFEKTSSGQHTVPPAKVAAERVAPAAEAPVAVPVVPAARMPVAEPGREEAANESDLAVAQNAPTIAEAPPAREAVARALPRERVAPRATARPRTVSAPVAPPPSPAQPSETSGQLGEELALLSEVRGSVQEGAPARALELLGRYQTRFGRPILGMEADALRVDALCKSGQLEAARASARAFQNDWPGSPLERRVSAACP
jgi:hypothetical protein